jgi:restriction system protein
MPRRSSLIDEAFDLGLANPRAGVFGSLIFTVGAAVFYWGFPKALDASGLPITMFAVFLLWIMAAACVLGALQGAVVHWVRGLRMRGQQSAADLRDLSWRQVEELVADVFRQRGYRVCEVGGSGDGGVDLLMVGPDGARYAVQCKGWRSWKVGAPKIREFVGALASLPKPCRGIFVVIGEYTVAARDLAQTHGIELIDGPALVQLIQEHPPIPTTGLSDPPTCPVCGSAMVQRTARRGARAGTTFWGCASFPQCRGTQRA